MDPAHPTIDILICTVADRLENIAGMLLPQREGVSYVVSVQYNSDPSPVIPSVLESRPDVRTGLFWGMGLSRNRNNSINMATADICVIADDDNVYTDRHLDTIIDSWSRNPDADIMIFRAETLQGKPLHPYPVPYVCSVEMTFRRDSIQSRGLKFDERFGLGGTLFCAGEEDVFMADARRAGLVIRYNPEVIVRTNGITTSSGFSTDKRLQITKGAAFGYVYGTFSAVWRSFKEAGWYLFRKRTNPFPILFNMLKGIWILR